MIRKFIYDKRAYYIYMIHTCIRYSVYKIASNLITIDNNNNNNNKVKHTYQIAKFWQHMISSRFSCRSTLISLRTLLFFSYVELHQFLLPKKSLPHHHIQVTSKLNNENLSSHYFWIFHSFWSLKILT